MNVWIKVLKPLKELYDEGTIVKEQLARVIDWEQKGWVERVKAPDNGKEVIKKAKPTTSPKK